MKQVGHADAQMFFYVDAAKELAAKIRGNVKVIAEEPYYRYIPKKRLKALHKGQYGGVWSIQNGKDDTSKTIIKYTAMLDR